MSATQQASLSRPQSDVSAAVGLVGLAGLFAWVAFARAFPWLAERFDGLEEDPQTRSHSP